MDSFPPPMFWKSKRLTCEIYEGGTLLDLTTCAYAELLSLVTAIQEIWKVSENPDIWYTVEMKEKKSFFREPTYSIRVACYKLSPNAWKGKQQIRFQTIPHGRSLQTPVVIHPHPTLTHTWRQPVEVIFRFK